MDLQAAIQQITEESVVPEDQVADPGEVVWEVRGVVTAAEVTTWPLAPELTEAYCTVLQASVTRSPPPSGAQRREPEKLGRIRP